MCVSKEHSFQHSGFDLHATLLNTALIMSWINPASARRLRLPPLSSFLQRSCQNANPQAHPACICALCLCLHMDRAHTKCLCHDLWFSCSLWNAVMCDAALWADMNNWEINWMWSKLRFQNPAEALLSPKNRQQLHRSQISLPNLHIHLHIHTHIRSDLNSHASHAAHLRGQ